MAELERERSWGPTAFLTSEVVVGFVVFGALIGVIVTDLIRQWTDERQPSDLFVAAVFLGATVGWAVLALRTRLTIDDVAIRHRRLRTTTYPLADVGRAVVIESTRFPRTRTVLLVGRDRLGTTLCSCRDPEAIVAAIRPPTPVRSPYPGGVPAARPPDVTIEPEAAGAVSVVALGVLVLALGVLLAITPGRATMGPVAVSVLLVAGAGMAASAWRALRRARSPVDADPTGLRPRRRGAPLLSFDEVDQIIQIRPSRQGTLDRFAAITGNRGCLLPVPDSTALSPARRDDQRRAMAAALDALVVWHHHRLDDAEGDAPPAPRVAFNRRRPASARLRWLVLASGLGVLLAATTFWLASLIDLRDEKDAVLARGVRTDAVVEAVEPMPRGQVVLTLRFDAVDGARTETMRTEQVDARSGDIVTITVDPEAPGWFWTDDDPVTELDFDRFLVFVLALLPLTYGWAFLVTFWCLWHPHRRAEAAST